MKKSWKAIVVALSVGAIAGFASATLGATVGKQEAVAMPCCSECDDSYNYCIADCNGDSTCEAGCVNAYRSCSRYCSFSC